MLIAIVVAAVLAQAATSASGPPAQAAPAAQAAPVKPAKPEKPNVVCYDEKDIGSIISHRVCRTIRQTEDAERQSRREHDALVDHLAACGGQPSC